MLVKTYGYLEVTAEAPGATAIRAGARFIPEPVSQPALSDIEVKSFVNLWYATLAIAVLAVLSAAPLALLCAAVVGGIFVSKGLTLFFRKQTLIAAPQQAQSKQIRQATPQQLVKGGSPNGKSITGRKVNAQVPNRV